MLNSYGVNCIYGLKGTSGVRYDYGFGSGIKTNQWNHIVAVFNGQDNYMQAFLNGVQKHKATIPDPGYVGNSSGIFTIGNHGKWTYPFLGLIDTVRVYKRAVQEAEVKELYAEGLKNHQDIIASN